MTGDYVLKERWLVSFYIGAKAMNICQVCKL
jgi:hypothetical protein